MCFRSLMRAARRNRGGHSFLAKTGAFSVAMHPWFMRKLLMVGGLKVAKPIKDGIAAVQTEWPFALTAC